MELYLTCTGTLQDTFNPLQRGNYQPHQLETKPLKVKRVMTWLTFLDLLGSLQLRESVILWSLAHFLN